MIRTQEDRQFARFCKTGDPGALAVVFDRTAPEMLRVAIHLAGDRHRAEDLVQTAFVTAIESASEWDRSQRVLPWLLGILANRARHARRQDRRRLDHDRLPGTAPVDPAVEAERREIAADLRRAVASVPETYRDVLCLHVIEYMGAAEIAARTGRPDGSVRVQLRRGLEHLRRALPKSYAAASAAAIVTGPGRGLEAVRAEVLAAGTRHVPAAATAVSSGAATALFAGLLLMKKTVLVCAALVVAVLSTMYAGGAFDAAAEPLAELARVDLEDGGDAPIGAPVGAEPPASRVDADALREAVTELPESLPGRSLVVRVRRERAAAPVRHLKLGIQGPRRTTEVWTDGEGVARWRGADLGAHTVEVIDPEVSVPGTVVDVAATGETSVEIIVPTRIRVVIEVVDEGGAPVAGASVVAVDEPANPVARGMRVLGETDADGTLRYEWHRPLTLRAAVRGRAPSEAVRVDSSPHEQRVELQLGRAVDPMHGIVVDEVGAPVPGAHVEAQAPSTDRQVPPPVRTQADERGRFSFRMLGAGSYVLFAQGLVDGVARRGRLDVEVGLLRDPIELRLGETAAVVGRVLDSRGAPRVDTYVWASYRDATLENATRRDFHSYGRTDADGRFRIGGLLGGAYRLHIGQFDAASLEIELRSGQEYRWDPVLDADDSLRLRLVGPDGSPLAGWRLHCEGGSHPGTSRVTGDDGRATFSEVRAAPYRVLVQAPASRLLSQTFENLRPAADEQELVVPAAALPSARIRGRVVVTAGVSLGSVTVDVFSREQQSIRGDLSPVRVDPLTGEFEIDSLPPATVSLVVFSDMCALHSMPDRILGVDETLDLGEIRVGMGALRVTVRDDAGEIVREPAFRIGDPVQGVFGAARGGRRDGDATLFPTMPATPMELLVAADGHAPLCLPAHPVAGETTELSVELARGVPVTVRIALPPARPSSVFFRYTVREAATDAAVWSGAGSPRPEVERATDEFALAAGEYRIDGFYSDGRVTSQLAADFSVGGRSLTVDLSPR